MASKTFDQLTELAAAPSSEDWFALVDTSAGSTKKLDAKYLVATAGDVANVTGGGTIALGGFTATIPATGTVALTGLTLAQFAATTSAQLAGIISNETGSGALVFANSPTFITPILGAATAESIQTTGIIRTGDGSAAAPLLQPGVDADTGFYRPGANTIGVSTGGVEVMRWTPTANVLIGTSTNSGKLTVNGEIALVDGMTAPGTTSGWAKLYVDNDGGDLKIKFGDGTVKTIVVDE